MPRFAVLEHDHPVLHWDLMLEAGDALQTWRLANAPEIGAKTIEATALGDHRLAYLDYEGPVGGNRGIVRRWDAGVFKEEPDSTATRRKLIAHGEHINGSVLLEQVEGTMWRFARP